MLLIIVSIICLYGLFSIRWSIRSFDVKSINQIIYHIVVPCDGTDSGVYSDLFKETVPGTVFFEFVFVFLVYLTPLKILLNYQVVTSIIIFILTATLALFIYGIPEYTLCMIRTSNLYEKYYVDPKQVELKFNQKRNLIHIYLESVENTYLSKELGGQEENNYIKELGELCLENINFSHNQQIGGSHTIEGTQWTIGSQVGQLAGVPIFFGMNKKYDTHTPYLPGCVTLGDLLEKEGYFNELLLGSDANFGCTSNFYKQHGHFYINDYDELKRNKRIPEDYLVFWGIEDHKLFEFAKEDLTKLSKCEQPFYLEMVTIDTHTPDGYVCEYCKQEYDKQYANVIACQSRQVYEFVRWCQKQDWYENTTIVITGDHNSMSGKFFERLDKNYQRTPYNCFINSAVESKHTKNRKFSVIDFYPTILASMDVEIKGDRLGLGTNLFSGKKTLMEEIGYKKLNKEVKKKSVFYKNKLLK